jgi:hypothetical protein
MASGILRCWILAVSLSPGASLAHHAATMYDTSKETMLTGTVLAFEWVEPHTWTRISVIDDQESEAVWLLEGMNPNYLGRLGWNRYTLKAGDRIDVAVYPRKDGTPSGMFVRATLPDGTLKVMVTSAPNALAGESTGSQ